ncbi:acyl-CoA dehydrogenase/oxidase [Aspergillus leporis]|uniref:Acyl-CoA dehydrogenase/oxidase n=1 Tax=Aspergillus leporis TaxID=41062 RepID=A0A5N5WIH7_9EURO|nr:acyl-CoA dehydrogenase/oxidase [Aspergillus leporis]
MSLPYLINDAKGYVSASQWVPVIAQPFVSESARHWILCVEIFVEEDCIPADTVFAQQLNANGYDTKSRFSTHPTVLEDLKRKAASLGLWNLFLPKAHFKEGAGFSNLEYGLMAELLGKSNIAPEACNCNAPDTGNMEKWLVPLLNGVIRSAFLMTEPQVASSDATDIELTMRKEGNDYILNEQKWWSSGGGDERCKIYNVMDTPGVTVNRVLSVIGFDHSPHGHGHIPAENMILRPGGGFEVIPGCLGPGHIRAMRSIGAVEKALEYTLARLNDPAKKPFGQTLSSHGIQLERVARSRNGVDTARLSVLNAAITVDEMDRAMQAYGAAGVFQDTPLAAIWANGRTMRIVDGPDEVHVLQLGKNENKRGNALRQRIDMQKARAKEMLANYGLNEVDFLSLNRAYGQPKL